MHADVRTLLMTPSHSEGFREADVRSLCDLGASTKKDVNSSIGRKGIGFKSVFMVSDTPHILSIEVCVHHPIHLTAPYKSFAIVSSILSCHCGTAALWHHAMFSELTPLVWFCVSI